jgi:prepilin-type N-terminal cleavage/methylation domain-containing protein
MKRSGFTMIELIFVIVILGILASVAIPKLAATRDDAKISKALNELATLKSDMSAYYTSHGNYDTGAGNIQNMTNVTLYTDEGCSDKATEIASGNTYYYCTPDASNNLEDIVSFTPKNKDGEIVVAISSGVTGNIGRAIQESSNFKTLAVTVKNGGSRVAY